MNQSNNENNLLSDIDALKAAMEMAINGASEEAAKWVTYKRHAKTYNAIATRYRTLTGDTTLPIYDLSKLADHMDTVWPVQREVFETIYGDVLTLYGRLSRRLPSEPTIGFNELLHPLVKAAAIEHYSNGQYRHAVLDAITAVFDKLRERTGLDKDGDDLCNLAFSPKRPMLILSELDTESGRNDQIGFMEIFKGFYKGVRNPKAHSLIHDLDQLKAGQHLVLASILMRRVLDAKSSCAASDEQN